jgi:hypothetical protein
MIGPGMFDGLLAGLIVLGVIIGIVLCGLGWLAYWLWCHIDISIAWIP